MADRERYVFRLTAWNELAGVDDTFTLFYFIKNDGRVDVEILEPAKKRKFLSRVHYPSLKLEDIRPGGKVIIYGRMYSVVDYEDGPTRAALGRTQETSFGLITQAGMGAAGRIWQAGEASGLRVVAARLVNLSEEDAASVSSGLEGRVSAGPVLAISFIGESSQSKLASLAAHIHEQAGVPPRSLLPASHDAQHGRLAAAFFGPASARLASAGDAAGSFEHCACVLILPTAVKDGVSGAIFAELQAALAASRGALSVSALRTVDLSRPQAEEFLEVYKGVVPEYQELAAEYSSGPLIALEVTGPDAVSTLRSLAGPRDVDVAKRIRPETLRARYGTSTGKPSVHVTDLEEDGPLECEYMLAMLK